MEAIISVLQSILIVLLPPAPVTLSPLASRTIVVANAIENAPGLKGVVLNSLQGTNGKYWIYIKHLATGESYGQNHEEQILSASLYKAWLAAAVVGEIRAGRLREDQVLSGGVAELNLWAGVASADAELKDGQATFKVSEALNRMIEISNNYAAYLLTKKVGNSKVQKMLVDNNLVNSHFKRPPTVSALDMALFFEKVYRGDLFLDENSQKLRDVFARNNLNDGLPKLLPVGTRVEHKTGELNDLKHDCGIIYSRGGDYIICIMTESKDPKAAEARIAEISKAVYDYFQDAR